MLVVADKKLIEVAERNMSDIVPLYYNMRKAEPTVLNNETIYNGLIAAFTGGNIGVYSNNISKIWNSDILISGSEEERQQTINLIKLLCMENNFVIDYAKTLYKPKRPKNIHKQIAAHTKSNLPHFFKYAKAKDDWQVDGSNNSFVNKLDKIIPNPRINCRNIKLGKIDYTLLMHNPNIECTVKFSSNGKIVKETTDPLIVKYCELSRKYCFKVDAMSTTILSPNILTHSQAKQDVMFKNISSEVKNELLKFGYSEREITDILIKFLYGFRDNKNKGVLWLCYGNYILENLKSHFKLQTKSIQCVDCGEWIDVSLNSTKSCRCKKCQSDFNKHRKRLWWQNNKN